MKNYNRVSRANLNNQAFAAPLQQYDQSAHRAPSSYFGNYDSVYDSDADNYYIDDEGDQPDREYLYGKPTYHGEYKPTRYYYARAPSYNYYNDHSDSANPLDDLHEEMLQEDQHDRQRNWPTGKTEWLKNTGQPKALTSNFMKNLMLYNNADTQPIDMDNAYDDEELSGPDFNELSNQNEPYDYFNPLKFQPRPLNHFDASPVNKQNYFKLDDHKSNGDSNEYHVSNKNQYQNHNQNKNKSNKQNDYKDESHEDKEEEDLESLRKSQKNSWSHKTNNKQLKEDARASDKGTHDDTYNDSYDTSFDYDEDEWINWNRKRSLPKHQLRPLKALEFELTKTINEQVDASKVSSTTMPPTTTITR